MVKKATFLPAQPRRAKTRLLPGAAAASTEARRTLGYVEPMCDARTKLAVFFTILLDLELGIIQASIDPADPHEFLMVTLFDDGAMLHHNDAIDVMERRQAMRNDEGRSPLRQIVQSFANLHLGFRIDIGRRFIEDHDGWILQQHTRNRHPLFLPHR